MRWGLRALSVVGLVVTLTAQSCAPLQFRTTNVTRCDNQLGQEIDATITEGGWLRCDPSYDPDEQSHCPPTNRCTLVVQWNRWRTDGAREPQAWEWEKNVTDPYWFHIYAWMLVYELRAWHAGRITDYYLNTAKCGVPPDVEADAFAYATAIVG